MGCTYSVLPEKSSTVTNAERDVFTSISNGSLTTTIEAPSSTNASLVQETMTTLSTPSSIMPGVTAANDVISAPSNNVEELCDALETKVEQSSVTVEDIASGHLIDKSTGLQYKEASFNSKNIFTAIKRGDEIVVGLLLKENSNLIYDIGMWGSTPLIAALQYNYENISNMIIDYLIINREFNGCTTSDIINRRNDKGATALLYACMWGHTSIVKRLIEHGASIATAPSLAMHNIHKDCLDIYTPLSIAITNNFIDVVKTLVYYSDQIELIGGEKEEEQRGPESTGGASSIVTYDLSTTNRISLFDKFPFVMNGPYAITNNTLNKRAYNGLNPLLLAVFVGSASIVQFIIEACSDYSELSFIDDSHNNILHYVTMIPSEDSARTILQYLMSIEGVKPILVAECSRYDSDGFLPLHLAVSNKKIIITELLLALNAQVVNNNAINKTGYSCLHISIRKKSLDLVKILLKSNANPLLCDASGSSCENLALKLNKDNEIYVQVINAITLIKCKVDGIEAGLSVSPSYQQLVNPNGEELLPTIQSTTEDNGISQHESRMPLSASKFPISPSDIAPSLRTPRLHRVK